MNILALGAHPDDIEFGCGGTLAKYADNGHAVSLMVMTKGGRGGDERERAKEQETAREIIMAKGIFWGGFEDTFPPPQKDMIDSVETVIREVEPNMIFVNYHDDTHQDHRGLASALKSAARNVRNVMYYEVPSTQNFTPTVFVDIGRFIDIKGRALEAHRSQIMKTNIEGLSILEIARSLANFRGIQARIRYAEGFYPERLMINL